MSDIRETGAAAIRIELADGNVTVFHGYDTDAKLLNRNNVPRGTWDRLWGFLTEELGLTELGDES